MIGILDSNQKIVSDGLVLNLDAAQLRSYPGSGTTWTDLSGNGNNGTLTNGPTFNSGNGGSIVFDGSNDYIDLGTSGKDSIRSATTLSLCASFYCTGFSNPAVGYSWAPIIMLDAFSSGNNYRKFELYSNNNNGTQGIVAYFFDGSGNYSTLIYNTTVLNNYFVVTATINPSSMILYINDSAVSQGAGIVVNSNPQTSNFTIGARINTAYNGYFKGNIYNTQIYNRALSAQEVLQNYNAIKSRFGL